MSGGFVGRWSRRKLAAAGKAALADEPADVRASMARQGATDRPGAAAVATTPGSGEGAAGVVAPAAETPLPAVEGLTLDSDFSAFLKEEVSEALRRKALRKLFSDPHFNRMDGLDIYIDDYSRPDPIPPDILARLRHAREWLQSEADEGAAGVEGGEEIARGDGAGALAPAAGRVAEPDAQPAKVAAATATPVSEAKSGAAVLPAASGLDGAVEEPAAGTDAPVSGQKTP